MQSFGGHIQVQAKTPSFSDVLQLKINRHFRCGLLVVHFEWAALFIEVQREYYGSWLCACHLEITSSTNLPPPPLVITRHFEKRNKFEITSIFDTLLTIFSQKKCGGLWTKTKPYKGFAIVYYGIFTLRKVFFSKKSLNCVYILSPPLSVINLSCHKKSSSFLTPRLCYASHMENTPCVEIQFWYKFNSYVFTLFSSVLFGFWDSWIKNFCFVLELEFTLLKQVKHDS